MDQRERIGDLEEAIRSAIQGAFLQTWVAVPGIVESYDPTKMTAVIVPAIKASVRDKNGKQSFIEITQLVDVPVVFPAGGGFIVTLPLIQGDEVLVVFSNRCIDAWFQLGGIQIPTEKRFNGISDGFAIPGPRSLPNVVPGISATSAQLRKNDGSAYLELTQGGALNIVAPGGVNITGNLAVVGAETISQTLEVSGVANVDGQLNAKAGLAVTGDETVSGKITAQGEVAASGGAHTVSAHVHGGVQAGLANTLGPTG